VSRRPASSLLALLLTAGCAGAPPAPDVPITGDPAVLVFTRTTGYRHDSIPAAVAALEQWAVREGFGILATDDPDQFTTRGLAPFDAVVWLSTTGDVLSDPQQAAFEEYVRAGGGFVGIHAAADTEYDWAWYGELVGAYFASHPPVQAATVRVVDPDHPSTAGLPMPWTRTDEWYDFRTAPGPRVHVLATVDESTYQGGAMGADHPISWCHEFDGGRAWYTGMGHTAESYADEDFLHHIAGGIRYAAGVEARCG
jgi:type 1 glutamine amidotransferase